LTNPLLDTWHIHARIVVYVLDNIAEGAFAAPAPSKGRDFMGMFAHIHNVRLMWLKSAAPDLLSALNKIEKGQPLDRAGLRAALEASAQAMGSMLEQAIASGGKVKGFKPHASAFVGYLIAHESYHLGEIGIALNQIGFPLDQKVAFGMWEWGSR
jgi:uncharacterized damage-inducible protein DinB